MKVLAAIVGVCGLFLHEVSCQSSVGPSVACTSDADCSEYPGTYCGYYSQCKKCRCPSTGYVYESTSKSCLASRKINDACTNLAQCPDGGAGVGLCTSSKCVCASGYIASTDLKSCSKPKEGEACTVAVGCISASTMDCTSDKCACKADYPTVSTDKLTCRKSYIEESCTIDAGCSPTGATCVSTKCACPTNSAGATADKKTCNLQVIGGTCTSDGECITNAACNSNLCACGTPNVEISSTECRLPRYGEACTATPGCDTTFDSRLTCASLLCACSAGYVSTGVTVACAKINVGSACVDSASPTTCGTNAACTSSVCVCTAKYTTNANGYDCDAPVLGAACTATNNECVGTNVDPTCPAAGTCVCAAKTMVDPTDSKSCRKAIYDEACTSVDCDTNLQCDSTTNKCACTTNNVYDSTISACRNTAAEVAVKDGGTCTAIPANPDWTTTSPAVYKQCDTSLTGTALLTCRQCDSTGTFTCNTGIQDPSGSVTTHANVALLLIATVLSAFFKL